jgi:hypothetical protein
LTVLTTNSVRSRDGETRFESRTDLDKRLHSASPLYLLGAHAAGDFSRVPLDASNDRVGIGTLLGSLIELFDDDDLLACLTALQDDGNLK